MRKLIILAGFLCLYIFSYAQNDTLPTVEIKKLSTHWIILDLGVSNYFDHTNYSAVNPYLYNRLGAAAFIPGATSPSPLSKSDFNVNTFKSLNINIWLFMQRLSLYKNYVNLKYGLGVELNNYKYKSTSNISYLASNPFTVDATSASPIVYRDSIQFSVNKLAVDYVTIPLMLDFLTKPGGGIKKGLSISLGISAGYSYSYRNKQVSFERGVQSNKGDFNLEKFKYSYVAEFGSGPVKLKGTHKPQIFYRLLLGFGKIRFYGSYTPKDLYISGLKMNPYNVGLRFVNW